MTVEEKLRLLSMLMCLAPQNGQRYSDDDIAKFIEQAQKLEEWVSK